MGRGGLFWNSLINGVDGDYIVADVRTLGVWVASRRLFFMHLTVRLPLRDRMVSSLHSHARSRKRRVSSLKRGNIFYLFLTDTAAMSACQNIFRKSAPARCCTGEVFGCRSDRFKSHFQPSLYLYSPITCCASH